ncbi:uncharacterized protein LOC128672795 [Plodia interpunctella]|uniref:uncharacterized protein LOC128672795 n=1 Tax=Plodia interpunctella TaxID=58824 RepID=UPI002368A3C5|nr:uncharacterized protein LOC128672795 [Plodia interpunctella]
MNTKIKNCIINNDEREVIMLIDSGLDPNLEGGWPIRLAARYGSYSVVKTLVQYGSNPHLLSESGASTLQLAVYSGKEWSSDKWDFLLSCCDSSQLADGAAVAIIFQNIAALEKIVCTGRCNTNIPTTLTGKTVEDLARGYKLQHILNDTILSENQTRYTTPHSSPRTSQNVMDARSTLTPRQENTRNHRNLSPSVAQFFNQTSNQTALTSPRNNLVVYSS